MWILRFLFGSTVGLTIILSMYTLVGSLMFMHLEDGVDLVNLFSEEEYIDEEINDLINELKTNMNDKKEIKFDISVKAIENYRNSIKERLSPTKKKAVDIWKSLFYCFTVYTSIGYGNIVPETPFGRLFTCIYAFIGIPLCLVTLDKIAKSVITLLKWFSHNVLRIGSDLSSVYLLLAMMISYMFLGYFLYEGNEKWKSGEALYFLFITFTTIGFGDLSPEDSKFFMITILYQFIGLAMMASLINLIASKFEVDSSLANENKTKYD